jgi:hypothetical protein
MPRFVVFYVSADGRRCNSDTVDAVDIDRAASESIARQNFGTGSAWFVAGVIQEDKSSEVSGMLEGLLS